MQSAFGHFTILPMTPPKPADIVRKTRMLAILFAVYFVVYVVAGNIQLKPPGKWTYAAWLLITSGFAMGSNLS
eukprot:763100-Hanusia_phi.AAC.16